MPDDAGILQRSLGDQVAASPIVLAAITGVSVVLIVSPAGAYAGFRV